MFVSPFSVENSVALLMQAANGNTFDEIRSGLHLTGDKTSAATQFFQHYQNLEKGVGRSSWTMANQIYVPEGHQVRKEFHDAAVYLFKSGISSVNFGNPVETVRIINEYIHAQTHGMIKNLYKPDMINPDTQAVLVNAVYFKGNWETRFDTRGTKEEQFYVSETDTVQANFMHKRNYFNYGVLEDLQASVLEMNYANSNLSFLAILPFSRTGLPALQRHLDNYKVDQISNRLQQHMIDVSIPKFKIDFTLNANNVLKNVSVIHEADLFFEFINLISVCLA